MKNGERYLLSIFHLMSVVMSFVSSIIMSVIVLVNSPAIIISPSSWFPCVASSIVFPAAFTVSRTFMRWFGPMATTIFIAAIAFAPIFIYPDVAWARLCTSYDYGANGADMHIYLG